MISIFKFPDVEKTFSSWFQHCVLAVTILLFSQCKDPYTPPEITNSPSYLVVDGFINSKDSTLFKLSKTVNLSATKTTNPVRGALVEIQGDNHLTIALADKGSGKYMAYHGALDPSAKYRLSITLQEGSNYVSEFVEVKNAPPIDTIGYNAGADALNLLISTHDDAQKSRFYKWDFVDTWTYHAYYTSTYMYKDYHKFVERTPEQQIYRCWKSDSVPSYVLGTSTQLGTDVISRISIHEIPSNSTKISDLYSCNVRQFVLTEEGFQYWDNIRKLSQSMGSIFDPQPNQLKGNLRNVDNSEEPVIGFVSAGSFSEKRIFIRNKDLPYFMQLDPECEGQIESKKIRDAPYESFRSNHVIPIEIVVPQPYLDTFVEFVNVKCADCRYKGGTNKKPSYWPLF